MLYPTCLLVNDDLIGILIKVNKLEMLKMKDSTMGLEALSLLICELLLFIKLHCSEVDSVNFILFFW